MCMIRSIHLLCIEDFIFGVLLPDFISGNKVGQKCGWHGACTAVTGQQNHHHAVNHPCRYRLTLIGQGKCMYILSVRFVNS